MVRKEREGSGKGKEGKGKGGEWGKSSLCGWKATIRESQSFGAQNFTLICGRDMGRGQN